MRINGRWYSQFLASFSEDVSVEIAYFEKNLFNIFMQTPTHSLSYSGSPGISGIDTQIWV
jgi:hypothetical protein